MRSDNETEYMPHLSLLGVGRMLRSLLPVCAWCKDVRNERGYWMQAEPQVTEHPDMEMSHGICPACAEKLYREMEEVETEAWNEEGPPGIVPRGPQM